MEQVTTFPTQVLGIDEIVPYWRNPRRVPEDAVNAIGASISQYGMQQPIVVDADKVIIIGHTRYSALRRLGVERVEVVVADLPAKAAKELRVIDNRTAEFTSWDFEALAAEVTDLDSASLRQFFPDISVDGLHQPVVEQAPAGRDWTEVQPETDFVCPKCWHSFSVVVTRDAIMSGTIKGEAAA